MLIETHDYAPLNKNLSYDLKPGSTPCGLDLILY